MPSSYKPKTKHYKPEWSELTVNLYVSHLGREAVGRLAERLGVGPGYAADLVVRCLDTETAAELCEQLKAEDAQVLDAWRRQGQ